MSQPAVRSASPLFLTAWLTTRIARRKYGRGDEKPAKRSAVELTPRVIARRARAIMELRATGSASVAHRRTTVMTTATTRCPAAERPAGRGRIRRRTKSARDPRKSPKDRPLENFSVSLSSIERARTDRAQVSKSRGPL